MGRIHLSHIVRPDYYLFKELRCGLGVSGFRQPPAFFCNDPFCGVCAIGIFSDYGVFFCQDVFFNIFYVFLKTLEKI